MGRGIGLIGVPIEDLFVWGQMSRLHTTYIPHITKPLRVEIVKSCASRGVEVRDLGEVFLGEDYPKPYPTDRYGEVSENYISILRGLDMKMLERAREKVIKLSKKYNLLVAVGHSHLGALVLYDHMESVARLDYHPDYYGESSVSYPLCFASYMNWVKEHIIMSEVADYFTRSLDSAGNLQPVFGKRIVSPNKASYDDLRYLWAEHFDIDVDCIDERFRIQDNYSQNPKYGGPTGVSPDDVVKMVGEAASANGSRLYKLGFWEYRLNHDKSGGLGLKMIVDCIEAAAKK